MFSSYKNTNIIFKSSKDLAQVHNLINIIIAMPKARVFTPVKLLYASLIDESKFLAYPSKY